MRKVSLETSEGVELRWLDFVLNVKGKTLEGFKWGVTWSDSDF